MAAPKTKSMRRTKKSFKAPFLVTIAAGVAACGGAIDKNATDCSVTGTCITNPPEPVVKEGCPATNIEDGETCGAQDEGLTCTAFDKCDTTGIEPARTVTCSNGRWHGPARNYKVACPATPPTAGESCGECAGAYPIECAYGPASSPCGPSMFATCDSATGKWTVGSVSCNPPPPVPVDAGVDGG